MVGAHKAVFDLHLACDEVDQATVHKVRGNPAGPAFVEIDRFFLNPWKTANTGANGAANALFFLVAKVCETCIFKSLSGGINAVNDKGIDLTLYLPINALVRVKAPWVVLWLHLASDGGLLAFGIEACDLSRAALAGNQVLPRGFDITAQRGDKAKTGYNNAAHFILLCQLRHNSNWVQKNYRPEGPQGARACWLVARLTQK